MVKITDIYELKAKIHKLKLQLDQEPRPWPEKELANWYLTKVLDFVDELRLF